MMGGQGDRSTSANPNVITEPAAPPISATALNFT
jgi:hypothetical protein